MIQTSPLQFLAIQGAVRAVNSYAFLPTTFPKQQVKITSRKRIPLSNIENYNFPDIIQN